MKFKFVLFLSLFSSVCFANPSNWNENIEYAYSSNKNQGCTPNPNKVCISEVDAALACKAVVRTNQLVYEDLMLSGFGEERDFMKAVGGKLLGTDWFGKLGPCFIAFEWRGIMNGTSTRILRVNEVTAFRKVKNEIWAVKIDMRPYEQAPMHRFR